MSWCPEIGRLVISRVYPRRFAIKSLGTSLFLEMAGKPFRMIFGETYLGCRVDGGHPSLVRLPSFLFCFVFFFFFLKVFTFGLSDSNASYLFAFYSQDSSKVKK